MEVENEDEVYLVIVGDEDIKLEEHFNEVDTGPFESDLQNENHEVQDDKKVDPSNNVLSKDLDKTNEDNETSSSDEENDNDSISSDHSKALMNIKKLPQIRKADDEDMSSDKNEDVVEGESTRRFTMLKPHQRQSYVKELRERYEYLKNDPELLIDTLTTIMKTVKPPPLPKDYYVMQNTHYACIKCGFLSATKTAAGRHYQYIHGERYLVCFACGADFRSHTNLFTHEKRCIAPDAHIVLKARAAFVGRKGRSRPFLPINPPNVKSNPRFPCKLCSAVFNSKTTLTSHEYFHRGERPFRCHICPAAYTSQAALWRHTKMHTNIEYICDTCNKSFKLKSTLITHMNTHEPLRKHKCLECDKRFALKCAMLLHVNRVHRKLPPPCACQICPKRYPTLSTLREHMKKAHNMALLTQKTFFKAFPNLTDEEVQQAKMVLKSYKPSPTDYYCWKLTEEDDLE